MLRSSLFFVDRLAPAGVVHGAPETEGSTGPHRLVALWQDSQPQDGTDKSIALPGPFSYTCYDHTCAHHNTAAPANAVIGFR
ncbi:hypothetical protein JCM10213v2_002525 [Rhodosporidiobolus nylandii]